MTSQSKKAKAILLLKQERHTQKLNPKLDKKKKKVCGRLQASCSKIQFNKSNKSWIV
jgi:hypothetical protein